MQTMTLRPLAMVLCAALLAACGGGGGGGASPATPGSPEGPPPVRFAYVANTGDDTVSVLALDPATGVLRHQGYVHVGVGAWPRQVVLHPTRPLAFVVNQDAGAISSYALDDVSGAPTPIGSPVDTGGDPIAAAVHPSGQFVYAVTDEEVILAFRVDASGALEPLGTPLATGPGAASVVVHPSGRFAYTTNSSGNTLSAFAIDPSTGALASAGTFGTPSGNLAAMAIDPEGRLAAVTNGGAQSVTFFEIDQTTGALTEVTTILGPSRTSGVAIHPSGRFVYVGNPTTDAVAAFEVDLSAGTVSPIDADPVAPGVQGFPAGTEPLDLAVDPTGLALYVTDLNDWSITAYAIDPASGALTSLGT
ncbi:MAG TPA: beta-propeller fold lactonase family protein, partial [Thermodesulfobacteriota bacterium]